MSIPTFRIYQHIHEVPQQEWADVTKDTSLLLHLPYLAALEQCPPAGFDFRYAIFYKARKPSGVAVFQIITMKGEDVFAENNFEDERKPKKKFGGMLSDVLMATFRNFSLTGIVCGNELVSGVQGFHVLPEISLKMFYATLQKAIEKIIDDKNGSEKISFVAIKDLSQNLLTPANSFPQSDSIVCEFDPDMIFKINSSWNSFDDYLKSLSSKYRIRTKSVLLKGGSLKRKSFDAKMIDHYSSEIFQLYLSVHYRAAFKVAPVHKKYFHSLKKSLKEKFLFDGYFLKDKLVGFRTAFVDGENLITHFIGMDYHEQTPNVLYQNILYDYILSAINLKLQCIRFGRTALEIKSAVGATPEVLSSFITFNNSFIGGLMKPVLLSLNKPSWVQRNPFREE